MSLINKMLQDLDARGGNGAQTGASSAVRPVSYGARSISSQVAIGAAIAGAVVIAGGAFAAWKFTRPAAPAPVPAPVAVAPQAAQASVPAAQPAARQVPPRPADNLVAPDAAERAPAARGAQGAAPADAKNAQRTAELSEPAQLAAEAHAKDAPQTAKRRAPAQRVAGADAKVEPQTAQRQTPAQRVNERELARVTGRHAAAGRSTVAQPVPEPAAGVAAAALDAGLSSQQKAENEYRRALAKLQDARVSEAIAGLEQAVYLYPRHEAARQTLVSLLIEGGRPAEAIRHLTFATSLDPRQANMAMLLARLQLENGGDALATLRRSLPYAEANPDYRALMAGALQRANRHAEAAEHYQAAVRLQPANGIWWMGLGISLQADKRNADARIAFQRARDSGRLTPELQTFVERRLQQLN